MSVNLVAEFKCLTCKDNREVSPWETDPLCDICGSALQISYAPDPNVEEQRTIFDLFPDIQILLDQAIADSQPLRQISPDYLSKIGKLEVDVEKRLLCDVRLQVDQLNFVCIPALFGAPFPSDHCIKSEIITAVPEFGEGDLLNSVDACGKIVVFQRGLVSFATKAKRGIAAGASAIVIIQSYDIWPFAMTDSSNEYSELANSLVFSDHKSFPIPTVMISKRDGALLLHYLKSRSGGTIAGKSISNQSKADANNKHMQIASASQETVIAATDDVHVPIASPPSTTAEMNNKNRSINCVEATLKISLPKDTECVICKDDISPSHTILKLHCGHFYHSDCLEEWLAVNHTCPKCRHEMPAVEGRVNANNGSGRRGRRGEDATGLSQRQPYFN